MILDRFDRIFQLLDRRREIDSAVEFRRKAVGFH